MHMQSTNVKNDAEVREGDIIGYVGNTGRSEAPHVHYEIQQKNESGQWKQINPVIG
ncbi:MAG: M23 family metallopeptidase, partial [Prevotellaceae bacterium]|nr:M23 family metallopeptidase [Prevotellaceae bacterium]